MSEDRRTWQERRELITSLTMNFVDHVKDMTYSKPKRGDIYFSTTYRRWRVATKSFAETRLMVRTGDEFDTLGMRLAEELRPHLRNRSDSSVSKLGGFLACAVREVLKGDNT
jgi:hypothetical protein